jgi:hypothetical protein
LIAEKIIALIVLISSNLKYLNKIRVTLKKTFWKQAAFDVACGTTCIPSAKLGCYYCDWSAVI